MSMITIDYIRLKSNDPIYWFRLKEIMKRIFKITRIFTVCVDSGGLLVSSIGIAFNRILLFRVLF